MTDGIEAVTRTALSLALDAASLRQQAIASNIANVSAMGYAPQSVSFEAQLTDARRSLAEGGVLDLASLQDVAPRIETPASPAGFSGGVRLDLEAAEMARNALQYQALLKGLSRHFGILSLAASDGRK